MSPSLAATYKLDEKTEVWSRPGYDSIAYNDGNEVEQRLLDIIASASDCSVLSSELRQHCTDWPSLYHLSSSRANILRPFEPEIQGKVLEIGAGCGAITRYLGECGADVLALEGTMRRATICRSRTRDLPNVTVLAESFSAFETEEKFDVVTLIGVLEYASMFVQDAKPDVAMLRRAKAFLKPGGQLIIAIENQLGLKYFAGAPEDHVSTVSFGLEDRYQPVGVRTYGRRAIDALLKVSGFGDNRFFGCFPDYKFPVSIVSQAGFEAEGFDVAALATQSVRRDPQLPTTLAFRPERVWGPLMDNGVALDLANSFLISARCEPDQADETQASLAWHFSTERRASFCKVTRFEATHGQGIAVHTARARKQDSPLTAYGGLSNDIGSSEAYFHGHAMSARLMDLVTRDGWDDDVIRSFILDYFSAFARVTGQYIEISGLFEECLPGKYLDAIPQNLLIGGSGDYRLIDTEWELDRAISPAFLLFRGLHALSLSITKIGHHRTRKITTHLDFLKTCFSSIGQPLDDKSFSAFCHTEYEIQNLVAVKPYKAVNVEAALTQSILDRHNVWEEISHQVQKIDDLLATSERCAERCAQLEKNVDESNRLLHERLMLIHTYQAILADRDNVIANRDQTLASITGSRSWKITRPLRLFNRLAGQVRQGSFKTWAAIEGAQMLRHLQNVFAHPTSLCICVHAYYPDVLPGILERIGKIDLPIRVLITTTAEKYKEVETITAAFPFKIKILKVENRGRDLLPFFLALNHVRPRELVLKIHTKKSPHRVDGHGWRDDMLSKLLDPLTAKRVFDAFTRNANLGMVAPQGHILSIDEYMGENQGWFSRLKAKLPKSRLARNEQNFSGGTMFYVRPAALKPVHDLNLTEDDFEIEAQQLDGTLAHALERLLGTSVGHAGYFISSTADPQKPTGQQASHFHPV